MYVCPRDGFTERDVARRARDGARTPGAVHRRLGQPDRGQRVGAIGGVLAEHADHRADVAEAAD